MREAEEDDVVDANTLLEERKAIDKAEYERKQKEAEAIADIEKIEESFNKL
jgi:hypothetical protein